MTILYKMNNLGQISWWQIQPVLPSSDPSSASSPSPSSLSSSPSDPSSPSRFSRPSRPPAPLGYRIWWGNDHKTINLQTENTQFTPASDKPTMSVDEQIEAQINEQIARRGYSYNVPTTTPDLPMLAQTWADFILKANSDLSDVRHWESFYIQPKLDGIRCLATPTSMLSRKNLEITSVPHVELALSLLKSSLPNHPGLKLDGELFIYGSELQTIQSTILRRQADPFMYRSVKYCVFDLVNHELPYNERLEKLLKIQELLNNLWIKANISPEMHRHWVPECPIQVIPTALLDVPTGDPSVQGLLQQYNTDFRNQGYEGVILRKPDSLYQPNYRTFDLLKYKSFADGEFLIIDLVPDKNGLAKFICRTMSGSTFKVTPAWTAERKRTILRYPDNYIGRYLTVKYERLSKDGIPLKPIGQTIREAT